MCKYILINSLFCSLLRKKAAKWVQKLYGNMKHDMFLYLFAWCCRIIKPWNWPKQFFFGVGNIFSCFNFLNLFIKITRTIIKWDKVFKNGPSKICGRQRLKNLKGHGQLLSHLLKAFLLGTFLNSLSQIWFWNKNSLERALFWNQFLKVIMVFNSDSISSTKSPLTIFVVV